MKTGKRITIAAVLLRFTAGLTILLGSRNPAAWLERGDVGGNNVRWGKYERM